MLKRRWSHGSGRCAVVGAVALVASASAEIRYFVTELPPLPGGEFSRAVAINENGVVAGEAPRGDEGGYTHAVIWVDGAAIDVTGSGFLFSGANDVNDAGVVVGVSSSGTAPFRWAPETLDILPGLETARGIARSVNESGLVVGASVLSNNHAHAVRWDDGGVLDLGTLGGADSEAFDISEAGVVVGSAKLANGQWRAFWWDGTLHALGTLGGPGGAAHAINDVGEIVGDSNYNASLAHACVWRPAAAPLDLGTLGGSVSAAHDINNGGVIVGEAAVSGFNPIHAVVWESDQIVDMNDRLPSGSDWLLAAANGVNDAGVIVGVGRRGGATRGFIAEPYLVGDLNCDGLISVSDISGFVSAIMDPLAYDAAFPDCFHDAADVNDDGALSVSDIGPFVTLLTGE